MSESHFGFGRVNIDVDFAVRQFNEKQNNGEDVGRQNVSIGLIEGMQNDLVPHHSAIHEEVK